ncbi:hypothetical protein [Microbacterium enclense]|nr:hypothetical protein [Microbacterium enclense]KSU52204.1 hypothetical protein AS029_14520 [Microbacterium enclense]MCM3615194.1 hypothetical protein [Microbacterium enclense]
MSMAKKMSVLGRIREYFVGAPPSHEDAEQARQSALRQASTNRYRGEAERFTSGGGGSGSI